MMRREENKLKSKIDYAVKKWGLSHCREIYRHPTKAVFAAESQQFGPVILKIDQNTAQLKSEHQMLAGLSGAHSCKVYAYDESAGLLLEERIIPGTVLRREASLEKRIQVFASIFHEIHRPVQQGKAYLDWLDGICDYCVRNHVAEELLDLALRAREFCKEMFAKYPERVLLHGDLHHDNLLSRADGSYAMIDSKGIIGPAIMDLPRFILNELDTDHACSDREHIQEAIRLMGRQTGYPEEDIRKLFFMETVMGNIWCAEDGEEMDREEMEIAVEIGGIG